MTLSPDVHARRAQAARRRLRVAAARLEPAVWLHRRPWTTLAVAWGAGFLLGHRRVRWPGARPRRLLQAARLGRDLLS